MLKVIKAILGSKKTTKVKANIEIREMSASSWWS